MTDITYDLSLLEASEAKWKTSPALRFIYGRFYESAGAWFGDGPCLELGAGIGAGTEFIPELVTSDLVHTRYVDQAEDCYEISRHPDGWAGLLAIDVFHHLTEPMRFLESASKALRKGGRLVLVEPGATPLAMPLYNCFHDEPMRPDELTPPFSFEVDEKGEFANMGMAVALFLNHREWFEERCKEHGLRLLEVKFSDPLAYPLTGGYSGRQWLPESCIRFLGNFEKFLPSFIHRFMGWRIIVVLEAIS